MDSYNTSTPATSHSMFLHFKSNDASNPFWGSTTSTIDWCEENYIVTRYVAEMWNASSNVVYWLWPFIGMYACYKTEASMRYYMAYLSLMVVGTGSFFFHGTLRYEAQLLDELPMVYMTCVMIYCHLQTWKNHISPVHTILGLAGFSIFTTLIHTLMDAFVFFEIAFGVSTAVHVFAGAYNVYLMCKSTREKKVSKDLKLMLALELISGAIGIFVWANDNNHCGSIRDIRESIGYPFRVALEFHAWWHLLMGYSGYIAISVCHYMGSLALGRKDVEIKWVGGWFPVVAKKEKSIKRANSKRAIKSD